MRIFLAILMAGILCLGVAASSEAVSLTLTAPEKAPVGGIFEIAIGIDDAAELAGAALTLEYPKDKVAVEPSTAGALDSAADITSEVFNMVTPTTGTGEYPRVGNNKTDVGRVLLSGAYVDSTSGAGTYTGAKKVFGVKFKVNATGVADGDTLQFTLKKTILCNPAAGWGTSDGSGSCTETVASTSEKGVEVTDALIGVPADWKTSTTPFKPIAATLPAAKTVTVGQVAGVVLPTAGMNLISLNTQPTSTAIADVLASIAGKYKIVWAFVSGGWKYYDPADPDFSTLSTMEPNKGYWIETTQANVTLTINGTGQPAMSVSVTTGWNLIGYPGQSKAISTALTGIAGKYKIVWAFIGNGWKYYDPADPDFSTLTTMDPGNGYWIEMTQDSTINF